jgi:excisionase family DNA binding protein
MIKLKKWDEEIGRLKKMLGEHNMKEIMTPREAAEYLSVHVRTIYRLVKNGEIPCRKVGGSWRFKKEVLDEWLSGGENPTPMIIGKK